MNSSSFRRRSRSASREEDRNEDPSASAIEEARPGNKRLEHQHRSRATGTRGSLELVKRLGGYRPDLRLRSARAVLPAIGQRQLGEAEHRHEWYGQVSQATSRRGPWHDAAQRRAVADRRSQPPPRKSPAAALHRSGPTSTASSTTRAGRPQADDPRQRRRRPAEDYATETMFAYDQEFLYIALQVQASRRQHVAPGEAAAARRRRRCASIASASCSTSTAITRRTITWKIDQRGCVREAAGATAAGTRAGSWPCTARRRCWQIEAAIPLGELTRRADHAEHRMGVQRGAGHAGPRRAELVAARGRAAAAGGDEPLAVPARPRLRVVPTNAEVP